MWSSSIFKIKWGCLHLSKNLRLSSNLGRWVDGGWLDQLKIRLSHPSSYAWIEAWAELGNMKLAITYPSHTCLTFWTYFPLYMLLIRFDPVFLADLSQPDYCQKTEGKPQVSTVSIKNITLCCSYFLFSPEASMSLFLSGIVVVQLASHVPRTALNIYELCMVSKRENLSNIYIRIFQTISSSSIPLSSSWLVDLSHLLLAISSSSNVIIYTVQVKH